MTMKNRSRFVICVVAALLVLLTGAVSVSSVPALAEETTTRYKIAHVTDMHIFIENYANIYSRAYIDKAKGTKLLEESQLASEIAFGELMNMEEPPMYVFITGDLTNDGEIENHEWVGNLLKKVTTEMRKKPGYEGFQIFVIPGNHDLYNKKAKSFLPPAEEIEACTTYEELKTLLENYEGISVVSAKVTDFFRIYSDFGYCDCEGRKDGNHNASCGMADGCSLEFFYESNFWYGGKGVSRDQLEPVDGETIPKDVLKAYEDTKNFALIQSYAKLCSLSYIARIKDMTVLALNADSRDYDTDFPDRVKKGKATTAEIANGGWHETTGAYISDECLKWAVESLKDDVKNNRGIFTLGHANFVPHFTMEDEIISLFVYDNWEEATYTLADAGIRYGFSGHQHANDQVDYVTQNGNVFYDFETGSLISYGSAYRTVDYTKTVSGNKVVEDLKTEIHFLSDSSSADKYTYHRPELYNNGGSDFGVKMDTVATVKDRSGNACSIGDYLVIVNEDLLSSVESGMLGTVINESLYDTIEGLSAGMGKMPYLQAVVGDLLKDVRNFDFYKFQPNADGKWFSLSSTPERGYDIVTYLTDALNWVLSYDFGYGEIPGGYTLSDGYMTVYGAHLNGSGTTEMPDELKPLLTSLENGGFVRWLVNFLYDALVPQLQLLLDAPIRTVDTMAPLAVGKGFDIAAALKTNPSGMIDSLAKDNLSKYAFKSNSENGYYSLNGLLKDVYALLTGDEFGPLLDKVLSLFSGALGDTAGTIINLIPTVKEYLGMYVDGGTDLGKTLDDALIDKYVTDAFCKNLGDYAKQILESFYIDTTFDHAYENAKATGLFKAYGENYLVTCTYNGEKLFGGHTYDSSVAVNVVPTTENGLKPGRISYTFGDNVYTDKNFMWFTSVQVDIFDRTVVPESFIRYSTNENLSASKTVKANGENVLNEIPTIDLGIAYFNLNYAMKTYNRYTVSLTGLEEGKTYFYQVGNDAYGWSDVYSFTTGKTSGGFEFMAFSDIQGSVERNYVDSMNNLYKATVSTGKTTSFILSGGDNVDNGKNFWQYMWMLDHQAQSWANNTYVSVAGNHEKHHYDLTSNLATPSGATVLETGIYYSYNYQNTHFVILDTNDLDSEGNLAETQTEWLEADLAEADKDESITFIIVTMHKGPYTAGSHAFDSDVIALRKQLTPIFAVYGVNLVLQGHDHTYSVSEYIDENGEKADVTYNYDGSVVTDGVLYVNLGTMGDKFYNYLYSDEVLIKTRDNAPKGLEKYLTADKYLELTETPVYANISVDGDRITLKSYAYLADGSVVAVDNIMIARGALEAPKSKLPVGAVIGITVGAVALVGGIVCLFVFLGKKKTPIAA